MQQAYRLGTTSEMRIKSDLPLRVGLVLFVPVMSDHATSPRLAAWSGDAHPFGGQSVAERKGVRAKGWSCGSAVEGAGSVPVVDVVVLSPPTPVVVGESVDLQILIFAHGGNSSKVLVVG